MKQLTKLALVAVAAATVAGSQAATYNGDLLIGFTTGSGNDLVYDLGSVSSLHNGETFAGLSALLTSYNVSTVQWGVIGTTISSLAADNQVFSTTASSIFVPPVTSKNGWNGLKGQMTGIYSPFTTAGAGQSLSIAANAGSGNSWYEQTAGGATTTSQFVNAYNGPDSTGTGTEALWAADDGQGGGSGLVTELGTFTLGSDDSVTFNTLAIPEPATYGLLAGVGLLALTLRRQLRQTA